MLLLSLSEKLIASFEHVWLGLSSISVATIIALSIIIFIVTKKNKELRATLSRMQTTCDELDNQAKLIVKTDLELHEAQSELDKKIVGLSILHKIASILSMTLDQEEIFSKISREHLAELGFDKVFIFLLPDKDTRVSKDTVEIKLSIGYGDNEHKDIFSENVINAIFRPVIQHNQVIASFDFDAKIETKKLREEILKKCAVSSFVCAPILIQEGVIGTLLVGSDSTYSPITSGDKEIVSILAAQIGQTLENTRLFEEKWRSHQQLETKVKQRTKELSEALEAIQIVTKRKSDFVSAVAHELRTPLTSIKGYAALLSAGKLGEVSPGVKQRLEKINKHSDGLSQLINNILDISRIESGRQEMKIEAVNIRELLDMLADLLAPQFKEKQLTFVCDVAKDIHEIPADQDQLKRVFINLVGNALKYTPPNGTITIRVCTKDQMIHIDVIDTGIGIAEKNLPKIFEEFFREDTEANQTIKGTGLGMALVKYIVEAHKGKIEVQSKLKYGTTFHFTLPLKTVSSTIPPLHNS